MRDMHMMNYYSLFLKNCFLFLYRLKDKKRINISSMEWFDDDDEAVEEFEELYSITTKIDEEDLSDLENDILEDLDDEEEDIDF